MIWGLLILVIIGLLIADRIALNELRREWDEWNG